MPSNISENNIDGTYPIAGVDNDSQGFRTNFTNTVTNFTHARSEIEDLQIKAIFKSPLNGEVIVDNDMAGTEFKSAKISDMREKVRDHLTTAGTVDISHIDAPHHKIITSGSITINLTDFPGGANLELGRVKVEMNITNVGHTVTLPVAVTNGVDYIDGYLAGVVTFTAIGVYVFEFTSYDNSVFTVSDLTRSGVGSGGGDVGATGPTGAAGPSAYDVAVTNGFVGTEAAWLASLVGIDGVAGQTGTTGIEGPIGVTGDQGIQGNAGPIGPIGIQGPPPAVVSATPASSIGQAGDTSGDMQYDVTYLYIAIADFDGATSIWVRSLLDSTAF